MLLNFFNRRKQAIITFTMSTYKKKFSISFRRHTVQCSQLTSKEEEKKRCRSRKTTTYKHYATGIMKPLKINKKDMRRLLTLSSTYSQTNTFSNQCSFDFLA